MRHPAEIKYQGHVYKLAAGLSGYGKITAPAKYKGGFSDAVWGSHGFQQYATGPGVSGYIGSASRTPQFDQILEKLLTAQGLGPNGIASWLTSTDGRHLMDDVDRNTPPAKFKKRAQEYTKDAARKVAVWNHPDHLGSWDSSVKVRDHLTSIFGGGEKKE